MNFPTTDADTIGWLTTEQMIEVDRVMIEDLHIELIQMMENAGRNLARLALDRFSPAAVTVCAGSGGNGGGGLVAARHLHVAGIAVDVVLSSAADRFGDVPAHQLDIIQRLGIPIVQSVSAKTDLVLDAMIGYSLSGAPRGRVAELITAVTAGPAPILSLDTPSGIDTATGTATIRTSPPTPRSRSPPEDRTSRYGRRWGPLRRRHLRASRGVRSHGRRSGTRLQRKHHRPDRRLISARSAAYCR